MSEVMTPEEIKNILDKYGVKYSHVASQICVSSEYFSRVLNGIANSDRTLKAATNYIRLTYGKN